MSMFGARFAVFVRRARVLPSPVYATRNLSFLRFHRHRHLVVSTRCFTGMVRVGVKIPHIGNRTNTYEHVAVVHGHDWRTLCSVCATGARVAQPAPCCFNLWFHWAGTGWCETSTRWKSYKRAWARGRGAWARGRGA